MKDPEFAAAYEELHFGFEVANAVIAARCYARLSPAQLAARMKTSRGVITRLESGEASPSLKMLDRVGRATGTKLRLLIEPTS